MNQGNVDGCYNTLYIEAGVRMSEKGEGVQQKKGIFVG